MVTWKPTPETPDLRSSSLTLPGLPRELRAPKKLSQAVRRVSAGVFLGQGVQRPFEQRRCETPDVDIGFSLFLENL